MDRLDWNILLALQKNARCSNTAIGKTVGLSHPAVAARIQRLEGSGVIEGYGARIAATKAGHGVSAFIDLKSPRAQIGHCLEVVSRIPEIIEAHRVTGEIFLILRAVVRDMRQLETVIDKVAQLGIPSTSLILSSLPSKALPPPS